MSTAKKTKASSLPVFDAADPQGEVMNRTEQEWRASPLGYAAIQANLELKRVFSAARSAGIQTGPGSFVDDCWQGGVAGYQNAMQKWLEGDDQAAARFLVYAAACVGLMARDSSKLQTELHSLAGKKTRGVPRPKKRSPILEAMRILVREGMTNEQIIDFLDDPDEVSRRDGFPIVVCESETSIRDEGVVRYYVHVADINNPQEYKLATLRKRLSDIRNSA